MLRIATSSQNSQNRQKGNTYASAHTGVFKSGRNWAARISWQSVDGTSNRINHSFRDEKTAARWYDSVALILYGKHAKFNFPGTPREDPLGDEATLGEREALCRSEDAKFSEMWVEEKVVGSARPMARGTFQAIIFFNGKNIRLGRCNSEEEALALCKQKMLELQNKIITF